MMSAVLVSVMGKGGGGRELPLHCAALGFTSARKRATMRPAVLLLLVGFRSMLWLRLCSAVLVVVKRPECTLLLPLLTKRGCGMGSTSAACLWLHQHTVCFATKPTSACCCCRYRRRRQYTPSLSSCRCQLCRQLLRWNLLLQRLQTVHTSQQATQQTQ